MTACYTLTLSDAAEQIRTGHISPVDLVRSCLERIDSIDARLQAWVTLDREGALAAAQRHEAV
jgi:aspartyl-tRNA(Asn)/glutamyl-tRNA(Gln) amidotransferase subunit A